MATINVSGNQVAGQSNNIIATGLNAADGDRFTWNTSNGSSFSPNPSTVGGGMTSTVYTPANAGLDTVSGSDSDSSDNTSTDVQVAAQGGGGGQVVPPPPVPPPVVASTGWPMWLRVVLWLIALGGAVGLGLWLWKTFGSSRPVAAASETKKTKTGKRKK